MLRKLPDGKPLQEYSDKDLLKQMLVANDNRYAGELFKRYAHLVFGICAKYIKNKADCKDVTMSIFEKMLTKPPVQDVLSFKSWLYTITKNESLTFLRNSGRVAEQEEKWKNFEKSTEIFMENEVVWSLNSRGPSETDVQSALNQLKDHQRKCVELFFMQGKSYKEIEDQTEFSLSQIKSYLQNGKRRLKMLLESSNDLA